MKPSDVKRAVPSVQAIGVDESIQRDGTFKEFDVTVSVSFSPKSGMNDIVASKTERMSAAKLAAFREDTNLWNGQDFLKNHFKDVWADVQKQAEDSAAVQARPLIYVVNSQTGEVSDGQPFPTTGTPAKSSVAISLPGELQTPEVTRAPRNLRESDYQAPVGGAEPTDGNVPNFPYEANDTNDYKVEDAVKDAEGNDPQLPEQKKPASPKKGQPEQAGTNKGEQEGATKVVEAAQGGATEATKASASTIAQKPNMSATPEAPKAK